MPQVQIIRREVVDLAPPGATPGPKLAVTYSTPTVPPRTVYLDDLDAGDPAIADTIREDLQRLAETASQTLEI